MDMITPTPNPENHEGVKPSGTWYKATIEDPVKRAKHLKSFTLLVKGREVYPEEEADALEADLQPLVDGTRITRLSQVLPPGGVLYLYGAYKENGAHTAQSNEDFDRDLRGRNPEWGVRDLESVADLAREHGLDLLERIQMPANNLSLVFRRSG
jgi:Protein of unknown function (DUF938)